jgi:hypothetical protein
MSTDEYKRRLDTNKDLGANSAIPDWTAVSGPGCYGCTRTGTDLMVTFGVSDDPRVSGRASTYDMLLTKAQARLLYEQLGRTFERELSGKGDGDFIKTGSTVLHMSYVQRADFTEIEQLRCSLFDLNGVEYKFTGLDAIECAMQIKPSVLEGRRMRWVRRAWAWHNIWGHPVMQFLAFLGFYRRAM